jgi:predicted  nucleic acid-binding Zn-ribbon protein
MLESWGEESYMESDETLWQNEESTNKILEAISGLRQEMNQQIGDLRQEMNTRFEKLESEWQTMKQLQLSFDVRLDRLEAVVINVRADVKVLRAEVEAWSRDVHSLQKNLDLNLNG